MMKLGATFGPMVSFLVTIGSATALANGADKKLKRADVPAPVLATVTAKYPGAKFKSFEQEGGVGDSAKIYEVEVLQGKAAISVDVSPEGKILGEETAIPVSDLPAAVVDGLKSSKYKGWTIAKAERVVTAEKTDDPAYEVIVKGPGKSDNAGKKIEVVLDKAGSITKEEAKGAHDND
jgi:hypothetical protein